MKALALVGSHGKGDIDDTLVEAILQSFPSPAFDRIAMIPFRRNDR